MFVDNFHLQKNPPNQKNFLFTNDGEFFKIYLNIE